MSVPLFFSRRSVLATLSAVLVAASGGRDQNWAARAENACAADEAIELVAPSDGPPLMRGLSHFRRLRRDANGFA